MGQTLEASPRSVSSSQILWPGFQSAESVPYPAQPSQKLARKHHIYNTRVPLLAVLVVDASLWIVHLGHLQYEFPEAPPSRPNPHTMRGLSNGLLSRRVSHHCLNPHFPLLLLSPRADLLSPCLPCSNDFFRHGLD